MQLIDRIKNLFRRKHSPDRIVVLEKGKRPYIVLPKSEHAIYLKKKMEHDEAIGRDTIFDQYDES